MTSKVHIIYGGKTPCGTVFTIDAPPPKWAGSVTYAICVPNKDGTYRARYVEHSRDGIDKIQRSMRRLEDTTRHLGETLVAVRVQPLGKEKR